MPINDGTWVRPGEICKASCMHYYVPDCPFGVHKIKSTLDYKVPFANGLCPYYLKETEDDILVEEMLQASPKNILVKEANKFTDSELDITIYRLIRSASAKTQKKLFEYWRYLFPDEYAAEMVDDINLSGQKAKRKKEKK